MATINTFESVYHDKEPRGKTNSTKLLIITSANDDDDEEKILSYLNPRTTETIVLNLNNQRLIDIHSINNKNNKRSLPPLVNETLNDDDSKTVNTKRRKDDLSCVICGGSASGYNFDRITCESCKAFFRRNALHLIEKTKCLTLKNNSDGKRCNIRYDVKNKCQRCRLLKCFEEGMRKDFILTQEEKLSKQLRLEENRRIRSTQTKINVNDFKTEHTDESLSIYTKCEPIIGMPLFPSSCLSEADWSCLNYIQIAYLSASQSSPSASSVISLELAPDKMSAYMNTLDIQNFAAVKLINFIRQIPEFIQLDERDRLILVKYNLALLFSLRLGLSFDTTREIIYQDEMTSPISLAEEAFAHHCKSLFMLCYGYEFNCLFMSLLHSITNLVGKDPIIVQLLMLTMIFLKGLSVNDDEEPSLNDDQRVFQAQSKYTDLLFRYLIERSSFNLAVIKMMRIVEVFIKIQKVIREFQQYIKDKVDVNQINPLMKSLLHLT